MVIDFDEQFKIRLASNDEAMDKHDLVKTFLVRLLKRKYRKDMNYILIYTERPIELSNGDIKIVDVYFQNVKTKQIVCYEIQKNVSKEWLENTNEFYNKYEKSLINLYMKKDWQLVELNKISNDISKWDNEIGKYVI